MPYECGNTMVTAEADPEEERHQKWIQLEKSIKQGFNYKNKIADLKCKNQPERS